MRKKKWARPELDNCKYFLQDPNINRGKWREYIGNDNPIYIELGCGKGNFISKIACKNRNINFIAIDIKDDMLGYARRKIEETYDGKNIYNITLLAYDIERIRRYIQRKR